MGVRVSTGKIEMKSERKNIKCRYRETEREKKILSERMLVVMVGYGREIEKQKKERIKEEWLMLLKKEEGK